MKKVLVLGASGFIGKAVCEAMPNHYEVYGTYHHHKIKPQGTMMVNYDIAQEEQLTNILETVEPDMVISCLRGDFIHQLEAHRVLANYLKDKGERLFYVSSANVFDAIPNKAHVESDQVASNSDYGKFKIRCEAMLRDILGPMVTILRLPIVFGKTSKRILDIKEGLKNGGPLIIYRDYYLSIHSDTLLARQIAYLVEHDNEGTIHLGSHNVAGYDEAMALLMKQLGYSNIKLQFERIQDQPYYMALSTEKNILPIDLMWSVEQVIQSIV